MLNDRCWDESLIRCRVNSILLDSVVVSLNNDSVSYHRTLICERVNAKFFFFDYIH